MNKKDLQAQLAGTVHAVMRKKEYIERAYPFWKQHEKLEDKFYRQEQKLEKKMNKSLRKQGLKTRVEFFYVDGGCVGIGAGDYDYRQNFPLIHDLEFRDYERNLALRKKKSRARAYKI